MHKAGQISQTTIEVVIVIGIVILVNVLGQFFYSRLDLTEDKRYTLAESSQSIVSDLPDNVYIKVYVSSELPPEYQTKKEELMDLLQEYQASASSRLVVQYINPADLSEEELSTLEAKGIQERIYAARGADSSTQKVAFFDMEIDYLEDYKVIPTIPQQQKLEYEITSSILKMTSEEIPTVGFLTGHGELSRENDFKQLSDMIGELIQIQDVDISNGRQISDNIDVLVIANAQTEFTEREKYVIDQFVMKGGSLVYCGSGVKMDEMSNQAIMRQVPLDDLLGSYGVKINSDLVADPDYGMMIAPQTQRGFVIIKYALLPAIHEQLGGFPSGSPATRGIGALAFMNVSSLDVLYDVVPAETEVMELIKTSESSFRYPAPVNIDFQQDFSLLAGDDVQRQLVGVQLNGVFTSAFKGKPIPAIEPTEEGGMPAVDTETMIETSEHASVIVIGNGDFFTSQVSQILEQLRSLNQFRPSNEVFLFNLLESLSMGDALIDIRTRSITPRPLNPELTPSDMKFMKFWGYAFIPALIVILGVARFWLKGQRKRQMALIYQMEEKERHN